MRFGRVAGVRLSGVMRNESRALSTICPQRSNLKSIRWGQIADHTCSRTRPTSAIRPQPPAAAVPQAMYYFSWVPPAIPVP